MVRRGPAVISLALAALLAACGSDGPEPLPDPAETSADEAASGGHEAQSRRQRLSGVEHWLYLIDVNLDDETVEEIADSDHDLVVLDLITSERENTEYPLKEVIERLHEAEHPKTVLAYIDIGEAEDYRTYWQEGWQVGDPDWLVASDPDGWDGNYPVAYWRDEWSEIWLDEDGQLDKVLDAGFDGVYLDWVEAYADEDVVAAAAADEVDPVEEMAAWVEAIADHGRAFDPGFLVVGQNAAELVELSSLYRTAIDAVAQEQVWFDGGADNDPPGDCPLPATDAEIDTPAYVGSLEGGCLRSWQDYPESTLHVSSEEYLRALEVVLEHGIPVFTVDYAVEERNVDFVLEESRRHGFIPFVGVRSLDTYEAPR